MDPIKTKTPKESRVESRYIVMPQHANDYGIAFGGTIMQWGVRVKNLEQQLWSHTGFQ